MKKHYVEVIQVFRVEKRVRFVVEAHDMSDAINQVDMGEVDKPLTGWDVNEVLMSEEVQSAHETLDLQVFAMTHEGSLAPNADSIDLYDIVLKDDEGNVLLDLEDLTEEQLSDKLDPVIKAFGLEPEYVGG